MSKRKVFHVTTHKDGWQVKRAGGQKASSVHETKEDAIKQAKNQAKSAATGQVKIHKQDGTIQTEHTYGNDPTRSAG